VSSFQSIGAPVIYRVNSCLLPRPIESPGDPQERIGPMGIGARARILVADDNPSVRRLVSVALHMHGYLCQAVADGDEALACFDAGEFDLLVTDLMMQRVTGDELAQRVWEDHPEFPVLFISGCYPADIRDLVSSHRSARFLAKPFSPDQLADGISRLLVPVG
jgi:CheY-like chemotaxis protein